MGRLILHALMTSICGRKESEGSRAWQNERTVMLADSSIEGSRKKTLQSFLSCGSET